ncbi:uncharacterized protein SPPG_04978 [Spizellomyces punctatus DAOM BR117]|uniref:Alkaline phosphatase n=1 Tax=Spizellomyces punctatus (strain DAOM BR117) TaxID=645134 RepID=A0A0L0HF06_SPIPD|nr:uncharacterized protein SPPG_04978 [Spizellomyces punctatus DAOM BR117]KNC99591.1 hypothetical protein SPPG_04978 [Spizellomyces punctatus DAOM BR117]|eukprot:XP_016607631.1 hypothetical protein SPPG_04978 [Spizellomyces punctatus DAOM BR117]
MKVLLVPVFFAVAALAAPVASPVEFQDNLAFNSPIVNYPSLAVTKPDHELLRRQIQIGKPVPKPRPPPPSGPSKGAPIPTVKFGHGVASGDPLSDAVIIWTKVTSQDTAIPVTYQVSTTEAFSSLVQNGTVVTTPDVDYTVKVDVKGLQPATTYYYRFVVQTPSGTATSPIGKTHTLPTEDADVESYKLAVVSCSNLPYGFFNAYNGISHRTDVDVVLHLGDYIYEYANKKYGDGTAIGRIPQPDKDIVTLSDYRTRHAQYKTDPDLQLAHQNVPWITVWDDHEFADNAWKDGAGNHNPSTQGPWEERKLAAMRAYFEYMPIRSAVIDGKGKIYRSFHVGKLLDLIMLDTRIAGRDKTDLRKTQEINAPGRSILGADQESWLYNELSKSSQGGKQWRLLGNQVTFSPMKILGQLTGADSWDGYPASRARLMSHLTDNNIQNTVILTGDIHTAFAFDVPEDPYNIFKYGPISGRGSVLVEFVGTSVTSPGAGAVAVAGLRMSQPHLKFGNGKDHGYMVVTVTAEKVSTEYVVVAAVDRRTRLESTDAIVETASGSGRITSVQQFN